jgi:hypothetical protein
MRLTPDVGPDAFEKLGVAAYTCRDGANRRGQARHVGCSPARPMLTLTSRPTRTRGLSFYRLPGGAARRRAAAALDDPLDDLIHARSRFQSTEDSDLFALYAVHELGATAPLEATASSHHTLMVVREFRRVPLDASALALVLFRAQPGCAAQAIAIVAHWAERAVSLAEPAYLLVAHSREQPRLIALLTGVHECDALAGLRSSAFSLDSLLPDAGPLLMGDPEWYMYCAPHVAHTQRLISPSAV